MSQASTRPSTKLCARSKERTGTTDTDPPVPIISDRYADTKVVISDGQWIVIGGLIRSSERERVRGVPLLMDIPYLGWFFKTKQTVTEKSNLVFFVQATVLTDEKAKQGADEKKAAILTHRKTNGLAGGPFPKPEPEAPTKEPALKVAPKEPEFKALPKELALKTLPKEPGPEAPAKEPEPKVPAKEPEAALLSKELEAAVFSTDTEVPDPPKEPEVEAPAMQPEQKN